MIVCPNCNHPNPDGAVQCEACYTPLPTTSHCPNCGATVQSDAAFCGQCGYNLHSNATPAAATSAPTVAPDIPVEVPPLVQPEPIEELLQPNANVNQQVASPIPPTVMPPAVSPMAVEIPPPSPTPTPSIPPQPVVSQPEVPTPTPAPAPVPTPAMTQLQQVTARLFHVQSDRDIELPQALSVIHIGKPNDRVPPDVDVSGFSNSEIVSRIHADIRVEGDSYFIEDVGSSNGTYINNSPLSPGNRHRLRAGDRVSLGKGDLVTFIFQLA
ncbi:FHA domain-containing protein [Chrysosporum bergii ANA360D]|jgi:pSer/pThr/pTyr-binding forkhead associated (FHA) protein|uniref:FHA domain-containing protein n=1 Tax=Chrysosporum bergii ANA360D TaxID=617107 RepID=A0AA43KA61_9CYAN|nr:FHA domain-containing protein [Chrysosporum bergii]MDH6058903.1 FHA domain-containing protein [Chrysosporum bergii ANA360D]